MSYFKTPLLPNICSACILLFIFMFGQHSYAMQDLEMAHPATTDESAMQTMQDKQIITFVGKIIYVEIAGGFYALETDTGQKLKPLNLPVAFQQADQWVKGRAEMANNLLGIHMWGRYVNLLEIVETEPPCEEQ